MGGISGLAEKMKIRDVIIPNAAEAHDSFTPYFSSSKLQKADQNLSNALATFLKKHMKNRVWRGWIYTSGSLAVQTLPWLKKLRANGFIGLELGISEAFTAGKKFGIKVAAACYITDLGIRKNFLRITKEDNKIRFKIRDTLAKALVEFICRDN